AAFAQSQLLKFIRERRYAWSPTNLGLALAGLPYMTYRQSVRRCKRARKSPTLASEYDIFRAIKGLCSSHSLPLSPEKLAKWVVSLPSRFQFARTEFKRNFYMLTKAVQHASSCKKAAQLPFAIAESYDKFTRSQSLLDRIRNYELQIR